MTHFGDIICLVTYFC